MNTSNNSMIVFLTQAISHKLAGHMGVVMSQSERFLMNLDEGIYKDKTDKEIIREAANIMRLTLDSTVSAKELLQKMSNYINNAVKEHTRHTDIRDEADKAVSSLKPKMDKAGVSFKRNFPDNISLLEVNPHCIHDILYILLDNAIEAVNVKGRGRITFNITERKDYISVEIKDTGCGIPQPAIKHIFEPFFSIRPHSARAGLGLFIAHEIAYSMGVNILCESKLGTGSTFYIKFTTK